ncbi:hypothetical protein NGC32_08650 [Kluyvera cryocrescens]|uniref:hypothetical protein n=1 Tax=Kluyvera cryocrescens TaxID=580 RepID=UPI002DB69D5A|nr:hypothetical protein [Kluyvera cryocrescens]MEB7712797.1 hypothetical protein [Kluyvera cryocrescens]
MNEKNARHLNAIRARRLQRLPLLTPVASLTVVARHLAGEPDIALVQACKVSEFYRSSVEGMDLAVKRADALARLEHLSTGSVIDTILEPVFLSLLDGTMRACNIGTRQGITPSRLYQECRTFQYEATNSSNFRLDSYSEQLIERQNIQNLADKTVYNQGTMTRDGVNVQMRNGKKMEKHKDAHFGNSQRSHDEYDGQVVYRNKQHAKSEGTPERAAQVDHAISCAEVCNNLKGNKALNLDDIEAIVNIDENYKVTSQANNSGKDFGKFGKTSAELQQEVKQGYVIVKKRGKEVKKPLTEEQIQARQQMIDEMKVAKKAIDDKTNETVWSNISKDRSVQKVLAKDAGQAAGHQSIGDLVLFVIKPLYYELRTSLSDGLDTGVGVSCYTEALKLRLSRMKTYVLTNASTLLKGLAEGFVKNFLSMLLEGIVNCFVGVFKNLMRMVKEGFKVLMQSVTILRDKSSNQAQKGDAILKLVAGSLSIFASLGLETWLNSLGLPGPLPILLSSVLTAVITALLMYALDKLDLFGTNHDLKMKRIDELLTTEITETEHSMMTMVNQLR